MAFLHTGKQARESITHNPSHFFFVFADFPVVLVLLSVQDMGGGRVGGEGIDALCKRWVLGLCASGLSKIKHCQLANGAYPSALRPAQMGASPAFAQKHFHVTSQWAMTSQ